MDRTVTIASLSTALLLGMTGLAGCGSSEGKSAAQTPSASPTPSPTPSATPSASPSATSSASAKASTGSGQTKTVVLTIKDYAYAGATNVPAGAKITIKNNDSEAHTVTADTGNAFNVAIPPGTSKTFTAPSKAGTYKYHCTYHANMHGSLTVG